MEIPTGSKTSYQSASFWKLFKFINEINFNSAINFPINSQIKVYSNNSDIIVEGTNEGEVVSLYNLNGIQLQTLKSQGEKISLPVNRNAIYLVKTTNKVSKVKL